MFLYRAIFLFFLLSSCYNMYKNSHYHRGGRPNFRSGLGCNPNYILCSIEIIDIRRGRFIWWLALCARASRFRYSEMRIRLSCALPRLCKISLKTKSIRSTLYYDHRKDERRTPLKLKTKARNMFEHLEESVLTWMCNFPYRTRVIAIWSAKQLCENCQNTHGKNRQGIGDLSHVVPDEELVMIRSIFCVHLDYTQLHLFNLAIPTSRGFEEVCKIFNSKQRAREFLQCLK